MKAGFNFLLSYHIPIEGPVPFGSVFPETEIFAFALSFLHLLPFPTLHKPLSNMLPIKLENFSTFVLHYNFLFLITLEPTCNMPQELCN